MFIVSITTPAHSLTAVLHPSCSFCTLHADRGLFKVAILFFPASYCYINSWCHGIKIDNIVLFFFLRQGFFVALEPVLALALIDQVGLELTEIRLPLPPPPGLILHILVSFYIHLFPQLSLNSP